ncbi:hypothetical protein CXZ10_07945 [Pleomorphomonas diazotrophica]|uniref:Uncharacterized protein n=1 Tax=Pleomorphomonas diazotrophica TaxID=1166257 RepID=A0A1I4UUT0_9HYPH|nr:hypothetical protein [Pleomorphomonas diazotrophica]PKR89818.1 hypothetical protein CXZ10_07945 [Pleomorphomonas diazotrophica]SFM92503.1 hypothetical protein SAMN05192571_10960 [Pleomorphomonas diazotrophica]
MGRPVDERKYRYKLRLTAEQTDAARPSILINRLKLMEADSLSSPEIGALADYSRAHAKKMSEKDRYILAFSLMTARQLLGRAGEMSSRFDELKTCLDGIEQDVMA